MDPDLERAEDWMVYATLEPVEGRGLIPNVNLPIRFKELVPRFYEQKRKEEVEEYVERLKRDTKGSKLEIEIRLQWDEKNGLTNISLGPSGGLDLTTEGWPNFQEHNLGNYSSIVGYAIATKYVSELLKCR
ncbi:hypothetical protein J4218_02070 [Candidatus Pacearchaeota archaeon]|nr:hypothetical protein [uncultured archaeon]AQS29140.1 hypothetical protein [uncultured archaeon]MBS3078884.1 hypothetical protein [Candidatus Pacearchaeota archaeon]